MKEIFPDLFQTKPEHPFGTEVKTCAYLIRRTPGNFLIYGSSFIEEHFSDIDRLGGINSQFLNHRDEASLYCEKVYGRYDAPIFCHEDEKRAVENAMRTTPNNDRIRTFSSPVKIASDFEVIPTPGHCPGSTCYLWSKNGKRYLFTGDTLYPKHGRWQVYVSDSNRETMIRSLDLLRETHFDVIVPGLFLGSQSSQEVSTLEKNDLLQKIIDRLRTGEVH